MDKDELDQPGSGLDAMTRRSFLGTALAGSAGLLTGGITSLLPTSLAVAALGDDGPIIEATIPELQDLMASGALTSRQLTLRYFDRIARYNPLLNAVIETNPDALGIAAERDRERAGRTIARALTRYPSFGER